MKRPTSGGIVLKKHHGQYFLRDLSVVHDMIRAVKAHDVSIFEIGCGDGFLTREIVAEKPARLWIFEIDKEWADKVDQEFADTGIVTMHHTNILDVDFSVFDAHKPWILLSNLPYHVTFPILHKVHQNRAFIQEGVVMVQEEVAQKIVKTGGKGYGYISLYFQHYFEWKLLTKVPPTAFYPQPKVTSRLLHFRPRLDAAPIAHEEQFWKFIKYCFAHPRRTLRNNLMTTHLPYQRVSESVLALRAQQMSFKDLFDLWVLVSQEI